MTTAEQDAERVMLARRVVELEIGLSELLDAEWMVTADWGGDRAAVLAKAHALLAYKPAEMEGTK